MNLTAALDGWNRYVIMSQGWELGRTLDGVLASLSLLPQGWETLSLTGTKLARHWLQT